MEIFSANLMLLMASLIATSYAATFQFRYGTLTTRETIITNYGTSAGTNWWKFANMTFGYGGMTIYGLAFLF